MEGGQIVEQNSENKEKRKCIGGRTEKCQEWWAVAGKGISCSQGQVLGQRVSHIEGPGHVRLGACRVLWGAENKLVDRENRGGTGARRVGNCCSMGINF